MLKIKDNVDLKELEKFGFKLEENYYVYDLGDNRTNITISIEDRIIGIPTSLYGDLPSIYIDKLDIIYDLIKADLVEKVSDKEC